MCLMQVFNVNYERLDEISGEQFTNTFNQKTGERTKENTL